MATSKSPKETQDSVSKVLYILPDKILQLLPIRDMARTSVLSKQWRSNWLSLESLVFDDQFFYDNLQESCNITTSILLHHDGGPVHEFVVSIPCRIDRNRVGHWLSLLSKNEVKCIKIYNGIRSMPLSSNIYGFSELIDLQLDDLTLHPPPSGFGGFPKLQHLVLCLVVFSEEDIFPGLMAKYRKLVTLTLDSRQLQSIGFGGDFYKFLAAASTKRPRRVPVAFNHLNNLTLDCLALSSLGVLQNMFDMIKSCPYMKKLVIDIHSSNNANHHKLDSTKIVHKSPNLVEVKITSISGSSVELQLIQYLLTIAVALERLFYKSKNHDTESELKLSRELLGILRASPKARLVCLR